MSDRIRNRGISTQAILTPVTDIFPAYESSTVVLPPASMVRVTCRK